jgi:hypothetical protein
MNDKFYLIVIVLLLGYIIFLQQCRTPEPGEPVVEVRVDTLWADADTVYVQADTQYVEIPVPVPTIEDDSVSVYRQSYNDNFLSAYLIARVHGRLLGWQMEYVPRMAHITRTQLITNTTTITTPYYQRRFLPERNWRLLVGVEGYAPEPGASVLGGFSRNDYVYLYRYDLFHSTHGFSIIRQF